MLIIFDKIQEISPVLTSMKCFCEGGQEYYVADNGIRFSSFSYNDLFDSHTMIINELIIKPESHLAYLREYPENEVRQKI